MQIIKNKKTNVVVLVGYDLELNETGCFSSEWRNRHVTSKEFVLDNIDTLPVNYSNNNWTYSRKKWKCINKTIERKTILNHVSMTEFRFALLENNLMFVVENYLKNSPKDEFKIYWETLQRVDKDGEFIEMIHNEIGINKELLEELFVSKD